MRGLARRPRERRAGARAPAVVLVVGGSSGIGLATARRLALRGDSVALLSRADQALRRAERSAVPGALLLPGDVRDATAVHDAVDRTVQRFGRLDAVVHTAQVMAYGPVEQVPAEVFDRVVAVGVTGTANLARAVLPALRAQGSGTLVLVGSLLGDVAVPGMGAYAVAKWGQLGLARTLQLETRDAPGVHVCVVSPGAVDTPIYRQAATVAGRSPTPPPPVVTPDRVATAVLSCLDRPRRHVRVGPTSRVTAAGFRLTPAVYDRLVGPLVDRLVFRGPWTVADGGNVERPSPSREAERGGWDLWGRSTT